MKTKTLYILLALVGLVVIFLVYQLGPQEKSARALSESEATEVILLAHPELAAYQTTSLPPSSIESKPSDSGWYLGFIQRGSGLPGILNAKCYHVGNDKSVAFIGEYKKKNNIVADSVDIKNCNPVLENLIVPSPTNEGQKIGETRNFGSVNIKPISVEEDSRCPANANCVWVGRVRLKILVNGNESIITLDQEFPTENVVITLTNVLPQKTMGAVVPSDYLFTFTVTKQSAPTVNNPQGKCYVGGCSGQICSDKTGVASTCEYREEYGCYKTAKCERQNSGQCGWTETAELNRCLGK